MFKFTYEGVSVIVRRATVGDELHADIIKTRVLEGIPVGQYGVWDAFSRLCSQTVMSEGLPFNPVGLDGADKTEIDRAYAAYLKLDKELKNRWLRACNEADKPASEDSGPTRLPDDASPNE